MLEELDCRIIPVYLPTELDGKKKIDPDDFVEHCGIRTLIKLLKEAKQDISLTGLGL